MSEITIPQDYQNLLSKISAAYTNGQVKAVQAVNVQLLETYWQIGQHIVEFEQGGKLRAEYGKSLINNLAKDLSLLYGKGFTYVGRQYRMTINNKHYRVDLVFYHIKQ